MTEKSTKLQRWLDVIAYLVGRQLPVSVEELSRHVPAYAGLGSDDSQQQQAARRMFERDKDELRRLGIPIQTVPYYTADATERLEGYRIDRRDFYLPYMDLVNQVTGTTAYSSRLRPDRMEVAEQDAPLALEALHRVARLPGFPLRSEARSAFRKLAFNLDPAEWAPSRETVLFVERDSGADLSRRLRILSDALLARKRLRFPYHGIYRDEVTHRDVAAYGLLFQHGHWYLIGHDALRGAVRVFRVGRMGDVTANTRAPGTPDYDIPGDFRLDQYRNREAWELGSGEEPSLEAHVRFAFPMSLWAERNGYGTLVSRSSDGSQTRAFAVHQVNPFLRWILGMEGEAEVLAPPELQQELRRMAAAIADAHGDDA
jgi:proteasome accessory factor B